MSFPTATILILQKVYGSLTYPHYHPNVHETYAVIAGSSTLCLGQDVRLDQLVAANSNGEQFVVVELVAGDVIVIPAGVAHCSKVYSPTYRYLASYPKEGENWKLVTDKHVNRVEHYDNLKDVETSRKVLMPSADPVFGLDRGGLCDIWGNVEISV